MSASDADAQLRASIEKLEKMREGLEIPYERVWAITRLIEDCRDVLYRRE